MTLWHMIPWKLLHKLKYKLELFHRLNILWCVVITHWPHLEMSSTLGQRTCVWWWKEGSRMLSVSHSNLLFSEFLITHNLEIVSKAWIFLCVGLVWFNWVDNQILCVTLMLNYCFYHYFIIIIYCLGKSKQATKSHSSRTSSATFSEESLLQYSPASIRPLTDSPAEPFKHSSACAFADIPPSTFRLAVPAWHLQLRGDLNTKLNSHQSPHTPPTPHHIQNKPKRVGVGMKESQTQCNI